MGLDNTAAQALSGTKSIGGDFQSTLMIGRQWLVAHPQIVAEIANVHDAAVAPRDTSDPFAESFFRMLGAERVDSLDFSGFEGATVLHDLNEPIGPELKEKYSLVFDGGSLEHVFNYPQALKNCMEMVKVGGHFVQITNANNFMGHGFWQVSPELVYRAMSAQNGYSVVAVLLREVRRRRPPADARAAFYLARDPNELGWRVELVNRRPTYIVSIARRDSRATVFEPAPQQSDYARLWGTGSGVRTPTPKTSLRSWAIGAVRAIVPPQVEQSLRRPLASGAYSRLSPAAVMAGRFRPANVRDERS